MVLHMQLRLRYFILGIYLAASYAMAQAPQLLTAAQLAASGMDAYFTDKNAHHRYFSEENLLMRPFVTHGRPLLITTFAVDASLPIGVGYWLEKKKHKKLAVCVRVIGIAANTWGAVYSSRSHYH
jgi:hypothetical protein